MLLVHNNISEGGYDGWMQQSWAGVFTETGNQPFSVYQSAIVRVSGPSGLCGLCGLALNGRLGWKQLAASMTGKIAIGKDVRMDGGRFLFEPQRPVAALAAGGR